MQQKTTEPSTTVLEQELDRISRAQLAGKSQQEVQDFKRVKKNYVRVLGSIQYKLDAQNMSYNELRDEKHKSSRLGKFLTQEGKPRPAQGFEAHAIVSGGDPRAYDLRVEMALKKVRIDDTDNGCWLPGSAKDALGSRYPNAVPHRRLHNFRYYNWLTNIALYKADRLSEPEFRAKLNTSRDMLQSGAVAGLVLNPEVPK